jgi:hypothetical protein
MEGSMRKALAVIVIGTGLTIFSSAAFAAPTDTKTTAQQSTTEKKAPAKRARHATVGVVKSIDATTMVITRSGKNSGDMTFQVSSSTHRQGTVEVGSTVSVRYRDSDKNHVATAITVQPTKTHAAKR